MTYWLVANPKAGDGERSQDFWLERLAAAGIHDPTCQDFDNFDNDDWSQNVEPGDVVMVAGGDGSVNRGARLCLDRDATLAVLPSGTANDFTRNLDLPENPDDLCNVISDGPIQQVDVAEFDHQLFLNVAHVGLGTAPVCESDDASKKRLGRFSYGVGLLRKLSEKRGFHAQIRCDKGFVSGRWLSIAIANGAFFGGGNEIPEACANDGQLELVAIRPRPVIQLLMTYLLLRLTRKSPKRTSTLVHLKGARCSVTTRKPKTVTADGDIATKTPLNVVCRPQALSVIGRSVVTTAASA
ncbi:diacylglycerol kinase family protein [Marinobacter sp.]|uniref:diacylglycerol kinase family protein n=1 Tax=Marinobacter sp. TaxID=50741 RepID=UPI0034A37370